MTKRIRTRIAPSPTGYPHVGTAYMALFNLIFAKHHQGDFILRIEDTDQSRSRTHFETSLYEALHWVGITWDEGPDIGGSYGPYKQSERIHVYQKYVQTLLDAGKAYKCFTTPKELAEMREVQRKMGRSGGYDRRHRNLSPEEIANFENRKAPYVIRLKVPLTGEVTFQDAVKGTITTPCSDIDDQVLIKSDGFPTYHLANVIDDYEMAITHVIRGDEWVASTPKHCLLYEAFGWEPPTFMHMPLLLGMDGKKLSKRKNPVSIHYYKEVGYLPEAFRNFLTLMGYSMPDDQEKYGLESIIKYFDIKRVGISGAVFDVKKLDWLNQQYLIQNVPTEKLWPLISEWAFPPEFIERLMPLIHTRIKTFSEFLQLCYFFFVNELEYSQALLCPKDIAPELAISLLQCFLWSLEAKEYWTKPHIEETTKELATLFDIPLKKVLIKLLYACFTGKHTGPPLFASIELLGEHKSRARILQAINFLGGISQKSLSRLQEKWQKKELKTVIT